MTCRVCGGLLEPRVTDLPFKIGDSSIMILRSLPVLQCRQCADTELEQATMSRVDQLLAAVGGPASSTSAEVSTCAERFIEQNFGPHIEQ
jgi:YgiT-type zinc finger domain-containing protein